MKTLSVIDFKTEEIEKELPIKKIFEFEGEKFAITKDNRFLELYHYRTGGRILSFCNNRTNRTIKSFYEDCLNKLNIYLNKDRDNFFKVLNKYKTVNK